MPPQLTNPAPPRAASQKLSAALKWACLVFLALILLLACRSEPTQGLASINPTQQPDPGSTAPLEPQPTPTIAINPTPTAPQIEETPSPAAPDAAQAPQVEATKTLYLPVIMSPPPAVTNLVEQTTGVQRFERFEIHFDVTRPYQNPYWPYEAAPPPGVPAGTGISVDGLFSLDGWNTVFTQPAFYFQPFNHQALNGLDHFVPSGKPRWAVRFAPPQAGRWEYRLRVTSARGVELFPAQASPALAFEVGERSSNPYTQRGFLRVSAQDRRYFEFSDGSPFTGVGFNTGYETSPQAETQMALMEAHKINFIRVWLSGAGINGSQWSSWSSHHLPYDGYLPGVSLDMTNKVPGSDTAFRLDNQNPCLFADFAQGGIPVTPRTTYQVMVRLRLDQITGAGAPGSYGFVIKQGNWLGTSCANSGNGLRLLGPVASTSGWTELYGSYTTASGMYWLDYLYLALENTTAGAAYIDEVRLWRADDPDKVNLLREPKADSHTYFDELNAARWDRIILSAEKHGVYLKLVIDEKNEWIRNRIGVNGAMTSQADNDLFYAAPGTKGRWLQQAWWRYLAARWGYSTAIHSFEYINEGDPYNGKHYDAANALARLVHQAGSARHMVTTSFWHSFPNIEFWSNPLYSELDYADLHAYISTGWGDRALFLSESRLETQPIHTRSQPASARLAASDSFNEAIHPGGLVIRGPGEWIVRYWMKTENFTASCDFGSTGGMQRVRWMLDGGSYYPGGREGVVPANAGAKDFLCTSPSGTFNWREFRSDRDRNGNLLPVQARLVLQDSKPHELTILLENSQGVSGSAWIDDVELINPAGQVVSILGYFDLTRMDQDTAWYNRAYALLYGGGSALGAAKPLVRGETGIDSPSQQDWDRDLLRDTRGIWLHNNLWGQLSPDSMAELYWWASETIPPSLYSNFLTLRNFMEGIPLNNGRYRDAQAQTSSPLLRTWGQRDDAAGQAHLWIQHTGHTWTQVVYGPALTPITGTVSLPNMPPGQYQVQWWDPYAVTNPVFRVETLASTGSLVLTLPNPLSSDVAVKISRLP
jgi:hypothetical protein